MTLRSATGADWAQVVVNTAPHWAVTLTYNSHRETRSMNGIRTDVKLWARRMLHRMHRGSAPWSASITYFGWVEKLSTNPHVHLAVTAPAGYRNLDRIFTRMGAAWVGTHQARTACIEWIADAAIWGEYIAKEERWRAPSEDRIIFSMP